MRNDVPVLVVGAGPVGLSTALFLAHWGVRALVIDKRDPTKAPPRAMASLRTLELFRAIGLGPAVEEAGWLGAPPMRSVFKESAFGATRQHSGLPARYAERLATCGPVDARLQLSQVEVQQLALDNLADGTVEFGVTLLDVDADSGRVRTSAGEITARYVVAADGAGSDVRERLGITVPDRTTVARLHTAFFRADLGDIVEDWGTHACYVQGEDLFVTLFSKNGRDEWSSHIMAPTGELSQAETIAVLRRAIGRPVPIELHVVNEWEATLGMASTFRRGRVFLAGDAAHVQSSAGGLGMNTGIQDAHNLAWKLASVLRGKAAPALLDTYDPERRAAAEASLHLSRRMHEGYQTRVANPDTMYEQAAVDYLRGMMFYSYSPTPQNVLTDEIRPGTRFPHRWVEADLSTLDIIGTRGIRLTGREDWLAQAGLELDEPVTVRPDGFVQ